MPEPIEALPDILAPGLRLVVCGTAAGTESAFHGRYYAGKGNGFWDTLKDTRLIPQKFDPIKGQRHRGRGLLTHGIGLTDLVKDGAGTDKKVTITGRDVDGFKAKLRLYKPRVVVFNGKKAAQVFYGRKGVGYGQQPPHQDFPRIVFFVATSTSGSASRWRAAKPGLWRELAAIVTMSPPQ
jgi:double-stranded uracil-DNA glycosylase